MNRPENYPKSKNFRKNQYEIDQSDESKKPAESKIVSSNR